MTCGCSRVNVISKWCGVCPCRLKRHSLLGLSGDPGSVGGLLVG